MGGQSAEQLAQRAFDLGVISDIELQQVWAHFGTHNVGVDEFLQFMVRKEFLTNYQMERLLKGDRHGYFFGKYKVLYLVGEGSFARVYRAANTTNGEVVAIKVLRSRFSDNPLQYGQFVREGQLGCTLKHPNIVPITEVYSEGRTHFLVMEFVEGQSLREFMKVRKKLDPIEATRLAIDIAAGLKYAFEHGLTHRDLKMSNVMISSRGRAKLADFGLAAVDESVGDDLADVAPNARTIDYAALERATGVRKDDTRSDVYFLGCIYYHMLSGKPPLAETRDRLLRLSKLRFLEVIPIQQADPGLPLSVSIIVNKAMSLDVNKRYQTPGAMLADLEVVARRLKEDAKAPAKSEEERKQRDRQAAMLLDPAQQRTVLVVESNSRMQDVLREGLKKAGFRVLLTSDPSRALGRLRQENPRTTDCVLLSAVELGESALTAFNGMSDDPKLEDLPAMLLLDAPQKAWQKEAKISSSRLVVAMPLTMKQLLASLAQLIPSAAGDGPG
jgi:serine/threonine-protein kinase